MPQKLLAKKRRIYEKITSLFQVGRVHLTQRSPVSAQMKVSISRSSILTTIVVATLLAAIPSTIRRIIQTGDVYLFTWHFVDDMLARLSGPGRLRFIMQPTVAIFLGARDGAKDARVGAPPFLLGLVFGGGAGRESLKSAFRSTRELISVAILLDLVSQFLIFHVIHPGAAMLLGPVLIAIPYAISRALGTRICRGRDSQVRQLAQSNVPLSRRERPGAKDR